MNEVTKEQILQLEAIGIAIAEKMNQTYQELEKSDQAKNEKLKSVLEQSRTLIRLLEKEN